MKISPKECLDNFVYYLITTKRASTKSHYFLRGIQLENGYLHKLINLCEFEDKKTKIPKGAVKKQVDKKIIKQFYCRKPNPYPDLKGLELREWIKKAEKKFMTKETIDKMKPKEKMEILLLDNNIYDVIIASNKPNHLYKATYFFRKNKAIFRKGEDGKDMIKYPWSKKFTPFELHVEWKKNYWYPLEDRTLPTKDKRDKKLLGKKKSWNKFSLKTRVGWNGQMIKWSYVKKMPSIFWYQK